MTGEDVHRRKHIEGLRHDDDDLRHMADAEPKDQPRRERVLGMPCDQKIWRWNLGRRGEGEARKASAGPNTTAMTKPNGRHIERRPDLDEHLAAGGHFQRRCDTASGGAKNTEPKESAPTASRRGNKRAPKTQRRRKRRSYAEQRPGRSRNDLFGSVINSAPYGFMRPARNPRDLKCPFTSAAAERDQMLGPDPRRLPW